jgi:hypothetical protein
MPTPPVHLTAADMALIPRLVKTCAHLDTQRVITAFYRDREVKAALAHGGERIGDRLAYVSGLVVAEVALNRRRQSA